jgi:hypothetical protein
MNVRTTVVAILLFANLTCQKSMRIFVNNAVVDVSSYLVFDFLSDDPRQKYGQTSEELSIDIRLDNGNSSLRTMDIFILRNEEDQSCYENAILMQDWTSQCSFLTRELTDGTVAVQGVT